MPNPSEFQRMEELPDVSVIGHPEVIVLDELRAEISELKKLSFIALGRIKSLEEWRERNTDDGR